MNNYSLTCVIFLPEFNFQMGHYFSFEAWSLMLVITGALPLTSTATPGPIMQP